MGDRPNTAHAGEFIDIKFLNPHEQTRETLYREGMLQRNDDDVAASHAPVHASLLKRHARRDIRLQDWLKERNNAVGAPQLHLLSRHRGEAPPGSLLVRVSTEALNLCQLLICEHGSAGFLL